MDGTHALRHAQGERLGYCPSTRSGRTGVSVRGVPYSSVRGGLNLPVRGEPVEPPPPNHALRQAQGERFV